MKKPEEIMVGDKALAEILENHLHWWNEDVDGWEDMRANLSGADLSGADLYRADLYRADLSGANLSGADLSGANLYGANLSGANLSGADLSGANLSGADLSGADLSGADLHRADLYRADLHRADLYGADLYRADLYGADLYRADLYGADLYGADLYRAKNAPFIPMACPDAGSFIGWEKCREGRIVELEVPADARRSSATGRKCRCDKAVVKSIKSIDGKSEYTEALSDYNPGFCYEVGKEVSEPNFCEDRFAECAPGIHFFINRQEAVGYV